MDFRNKYLLITLRTLFGLFMTFSGVSGLYAASAGLQGIPPDMLANTQMMVNTGIFHMIKITEVIAGLMLVFNFLPALAAIFFAPISIGIVVVNAMTAPAFVMMGVIVGLFNIYLGYAYRDKYKALFKR